MSYNSQNWPEDKMLFVLLLNRKKYQEARKLMDAIFFSSDKMPHIQHFASGALFVLDMLHPPSR